METVETLIPDNKGNHLVVVLYFYDDYDKSVTFQIPQELIDLDIADININKLNLYKPLSIKAFFEMCNWLLSQFLLYPNAIFSFICSTEPLENNHKDISPEQYRWTLFENFYLRNLPKLIDLGINSKDIIVGPSGCETFARVFYRHKHSPIIHIVIDHLTNKYNR
ncbi:MAG: hypothetical protein K2K94_02960 [Muribaculaceae bacterium]|nr:hypothetical protein [Muribaculaceae bacterium]